MFHLTIVLGTRPEIIKVAPIIREAGLRGISFDLIHTNQHYSAELDAIFFKDLNLQPPTHNLHVGPGSQAEQTARMMVGIEAILKQKKPDYCIVQGDTNSVLAGALAASKLNIPIAHVEAGLRSNDRSMPEEINRIITDHISSALFPPTEECRTSLLQEGISDNIIHVVGNTIVDSIIQNRNFSSLNVLKKCNLKSKDYFLLTLHRPANVDTKSDLMQIFQLLDVIAQKTNTPFFFPIHPRTAHTIKQFGLTLPTSIITHDPVGYLDFLTLQTNAAAIFTDSGGIQEEACILQVPCFTLRDSTERPETIAVGSNILMNRDLEKALEGLEYFKKNTSWENPFGDGTSSKKILDILTA